MTKLCQFHFCKFQNLKFIGLKIFTAQLHQLHPTQLRYRNLRCQLSVVLSSTAPNSIEIRKTSVSDELHQLHWTAPGTAPNCTQLHPTAPIRKSSVLVDDVWFFFYDYLWKGNIVKNCECDEYEFLRGLWESEIKNCNSGELPPTAPKVCFLSE